MQNTIILATTNAGKIRELAEELAAFGLTVLGLADFPEVGEIEETGVTFEENALLKAKTVASITGYVAIADDSGLEVDALNTAPGVYSARYGDSLQALANETKDERNIRKLLQELANTPPKERQARFVCAMAACKPNGQHIVVRGTWEGEILEKAQGQNGFGYDPVFFDKELQCSAAELTKDAKNARSHRGNALRLLMQQWQGFYG